MEEEDIAVFLFLGRKDKVIPLRIGEQFAAKLPQAKLYLLDAQHRIINKELEELLKSLFKINLNTGF